MKLFSKGHKNGASNPPATAPPVKKDLQVPQISPLEKRLQDMGPIREDGSDKFYGMENYGNTCYCNSILQCLYYSVPFREAVINYPQRTPMESLEAALAKNLRYQNPNAHLEAEALAAKQKASSPPSARQAGVPPNPNQKPEDKESPEYKKKVALQTLPILETKNNATSYGMSESLFTSLKDIFESVAGSQARIGIVRPQQFLDVLRREHEMFRTAMHQDAHEFLNLLLNEVVANVETEATKQAFTEKALPPTESADSLGMVPSSTGSKSPNTTRWVHELFEGTLTSETKCLTCEKVSQRDEIFLDLSVDLEQHSSVTSCLRKFSAEEMLCERNKFHCDNCGGLQEAEKRMKIKRLPRVLALHLKRFKYTEDLQRLQKLFHRVVYPYHLRLFNTTDDAEDPDRLYELYAVVVHIGGGPYHGHYVAIIKTEDRGWLLFDDELVEPVDKSYVRNFFGDRPGLACAYVLFYQETTLEAVMREQAQENQATAAAAEASEAGKSNGSPFSPPLAHAQSAPVPPESTTPFTPLSRIPTAPPLSTYPEEPSEPQLTSSRSVQPPLPPIPDEPALPLSPKKSDHQLRKERRAMEKEKDKNEKNRQKEQDLHNREMHRREAEELRKAIEASRADTVDFAENGSPRKSSSFGFLKRGSRSLSQRLGKEREPRLSTSDLSAAPLLPEVVPEAPLKEAEPAQPFTKPVQPIKPIHQAQPVQSPVSSPRDFPPISNPKQPKQPIQPIRAPEPLAKDQHTSHTKPGHTPRWRSFSFKKVS
ncbi:Peptidase C19 ubiquitin carboxyl-terminal hydrolase 2 [Penicillium concentricum]|uniref:Ubiquitin carboxyl-terminal hydrolase n=1 Tax=Penicillium concentricum TaxID=293559 RepID=A0A9W9SBW2_9EURO|nr:Peptidase C19 ubiquitin carboxyl-terminal hydrolase 2 [Penicillium concentricum]KAJ5374699.1 Peptidase C19 ubiquitin carboxyl-terminal hydrolase 2 [Penicillium concentricum]